VCAGAERQVTRCDASVEFARNWASSELGIDRDPPARDEKQPVALADSEPPTSMSWSHVAPD